MPGKFCDRARRAGDRSARSRGSRSVEVKFSTSDCALSSRRRPIFPDGLAFLSCVCAGSASHSATLRGGPVWRRAGMLGGRIFVELDRRAEHDPFCGRHDGGSGRCLG